MKKSAITLALLAASGAALAQSSVTMFGVVDAGVGSIRATGAGHTTGMISGENSTSRLGFRGKEDLGDGLAASFWLEGQVLNDTGNGANQSSGFDFTRQSTVSLSGNFGEVRLGRDFTPTFLTMITYDTSGNRGFGTIEVLGASAGGVAGLNGQNRVSNSVAYFLPASLGGIYGNAQVSFGERSSTQTRVANANGISSSAASAITDKTGNHFGGRIGYANGTLDVSGAYSKFHDAVRTVGTSFYAADYEIANIGASYNFGIVKPAAFFQQDKIAGTAGIAEFKLNTFAVGATAPLGAGVLRAQLSRYDFKNTGNDANKISLGYVYSLSKRTALYADVARIKNKGSATYSFTNLSGSLASGAPVGGGSATGFAVGLKHSF